jgi:acetyl esterase/lipase
MFLALVAGCSPTSVPSTTTTAAVTTSISTVVEVITEEYLPGLEANVFVPNASEGQAPLVVMVPGGGWRTADPAGFETLARYLADSGVMTITITVRAADDGVVYPTPVEDVLCAVAFGAAWARENGILPEPVLVLGHSSGAHLAAMAVLAVAEYSPSCPFQKIAPDGLIGLSGTYDVSRFPDLAQSLFGVSQGEDPGLWEAGNPLTHAGMRPEVPVLLIHGDVDELVRSAMTNDFGLLLEEGGHAPTIRIVPGADHHEIYTSWASGGLIVDWLADLR